MRRLLRNVSAETRTEVGVVEKQRICFAVMGGVQACRNGSGNGISAGAAAWVCMTEWALVTEYPERKQRVKRTSVSSC